MVPRQPVEHHVAPAGRVAQHLAALRQVRGQHALRLDHGLGQAGRSGSQHVERRLVRIHGRNRLVHCLRGRRGQHAREPDRRALQHRGIIGDDQRVAEIQGLEHALEERRLLREHHGRPHQADDVPQAPEVPGGQAVVDAHRTGREPCRHRAILDDRVGNGVTREDQQRPVRADAPVEQPLRHGARVAPGLCIAVPVPVAARRATLGEVWFVRVQLGAARQHRREVRLVGLELQDRANHQRAVLAALEAHLGRGKMRLAKGYAVRAHGCLRGSGQGQRIRSAGSSGPLRPCSPSACPAGTGRTGRGTSLRWRACRGSSRRWCAGGRSSIRHCAARNDRAAGRP